VVLDVVHEAVDVLLEINDDPTHLFGYRLWPTSPPHLLFGTPQAPFIPADGDQLWDFTTRQFRRTLA